MLGQMEQLAAMALTRAQGERGLGNPSALSSLCDALSTTQPGRGAHLRHLG